MKQTQDARFLRRQAARSIRLANSTHIEELRGLLLAAAADFTERADVAEAEANLGAPLAEAC